MVSEYLFLALMWAAYCAIHSGLISVSATTLLKRVLGSRYRFYRLFFNSFSAMALVPLVVYAESPRFRAEPLFAWSGYWRILQGCLVALAVVLVVGGARHYHVLNFLGVRQALSGRDATALGDSGELDTTGILGVVRHPWYVAVFILLWAHDLNWASITINLVLSAYLVIGTLLEERKLVTEFGERYRRYQRRVPMFVPFGFRLRAWCRSSR